MYNGGNSLWPLDVFEHYPFCYWHLITIKPTVALWCTWAFTLPMIVPVDNSSGDKTTELPYVHILNKVLPPEIRVLAWCPVDADFSARYIGHEAHLCINIWLLVENMILSDLILSDVNVPWEVIFPVGNFFNFFGFCKGILSQHSGITALSCCLQIQLSQENIQVLLSKGKSQPEGAFCRDI